MDAVLRAVSQPVNSASELSEARGRHLPVQIEAQTRIGTVASRLTTRPFATERAHENANATLTASLASAPSPANPPHRGPKPSEPRRRATVGIRRNHSASLAASEEPPLDPNAPTPHVGGRHALSFRWLGASVLAGITGSLLLGSAIYVSSDGEFTFADGPERAPVLSAGSRGATAGGARKADKLVRADAVASAKQSFRTPMTLRAGDREVIKVRNFVRIATNLSLTSGVYATDVPPFNPLRFFADAGADRAGEVPPETSDAEVSVSKSELSTLALEFGPQGLTDQQVLTELEESARLRAEAGRRASLPLSSALLLSRMLSQPPASPLGANTLPGSEASLDNPFRSLDVRVVPENVTDLPKSSVASPELSFEERVVSLRRTDTLEAVLRANGAGPEDARAMVGMLGGRDRTLVTLEGLQLRLLLAPAARPGEARRLVRAVLVSERGVESIAAMNDRGAFVSVTPPQAQGGKSDRTQRPEDDEDQDEGGGVTLYNSLYETAAKQDLPRQTAEELIRAFGYDVDFQRRVAPGDSFELFYATDEEGAAERPEILLATLTLGSDVHRVYRYQADDGTVEFFDEGGRSLKKFLIRKPVVEARLSSGFGTRFHPILGYAKMHTGVDWAARVGTPIFAAGNGTILKAEMSSGYGRRTEIQHANGYVTAYNHQSAFARGAGPGSRVRQGQVIGYVGSSGLSTGAHLHYEVIVNGHFVDPMKIRLPRGRELDGRALAEFSRQREQVDQLLRKANPNRLAQGEVR